MDAEIFTNGDGRIVFRCDAECASAILAAVKQIARMLKPTDEQRELARALETVLAAERRWKADSVRG